MTPLFEPWHGVFETLRVVDGVPLFVAEHLAEMRRAMAAMDLRSEANFEQARAALPKASGRWRWIVTGEDTRTLFTEEAAPSVDPVGISASPVRLGSANWDARFKTLSYLPHQQAAQQAKTAEAFLLNEHGHVASGSRGNIFWRKGGKLFTPAHEAGCRCGVVRSLVMTWDTVEAGHFPADDVLQADEIFLTSSMRGIISVNGVESRTLADFETADRLRKRYDDAVAFELKR